MSGGGGRGIRVSGVSRHLLVGFAVELVIVTALAMHLAGVSVTAGIALAVGVVFLVRWLVVLGSFVLSSLLRDRSQRLPRLGAGGWCRLLAEELWSVTKLFFVLHPLAPWLDRLDPPPADRHGTPVLLVHGFFSNGGFWWGIKRWLHDKGISNLYTVNLEPVFSDLDELSLRLERRIEQVCGISGHERLLLVAHSMGGLVCRAYLQSAGSRRIAGLITMGSPHHGTALAWLVPGRNVSQMRRGSKWLRQLERKESSAAPVPTRNLYSHHDNIVAPQNSSVLCWALNLPLVGVGHLAMAFSGEVRRQLWAQLGPLCERDGDGRDAGDAGRR
jgi:pimeloyl-ACP methyl ester carboxylesterase